jgi:hypothetical protein
LRDARSSVHRHAFVLVENVGEVAEDGLSQLVVRSQQAQRVRVHRAQHGRVGRAVRDAARSAAQALEVSRVRQLLVVHVVEHRLRVDLQIFDDVGVGGGVGGVGGREQLLAHQLVPLVLDGAAWRALDFAQQVRHVGGVRWLLLLVLGEDVDRRIKPDPAVSSCAQQELLEHVHDRPHRERRPIEQAVRVAGEEAEGVGDGDRNDGEGAEEADYLVRREEDPQVLLENVFVLVAPQQLVEEFVEIWPPNVERERALDF